MMSRMCEFQATAKHCTEVRFASFLSGGFITAIVVNPPEKKLEKRTSEEWVIKDVASKVHDFSVD